MLVAACRLAFRGLTITTLRGGTNRGPPRSYPVTFNGPTFIRYELSVTGR